MNLKIRFLFIIVTTGCIFQLICLKIYATIIIPKAIDFNHYSIFKLLIINNLFFLLKIFNYYTSCSRNYTKSTMTITGDIHHVFMNLMHERRGFVFVWDVDLNQMRVGRPITSIHTFHT